jgi:hypothetical protein
MLPHLKPTESCDQLDSVLHTDGRGCLRIFKSFPSQFREFFKVRSGAQYLPTLFESDCKLVPYFHSTSIKRCTTEGFVVIPDSLVQIGYIICF